MPKNSYCILPNGTGRLYRQSIDVPVEADQYLEDDWLINNHDRHFVPINEGGVDIFSGEGVRTPEELIIMQEESLGEDGEDNVLGLIELSTSDETSSMVLAAVTTRSSFDDSTLYVMADDVETIAVAGVINPSQFATPIIKRQQNFVNSSEKFWRKIVKQCHIRKGRLRRKRLRGEIDIIEEG